jgi:NAD-dependent DNA ligase
MVPIAMDGPRIHATIRPAMQTNDVKGKIIVLTGKFSKVKRAEAEAALVRLGATIGASVGKTTDILFAGERAGSKLAKATSLGVTIADEATLEALLAAAPIADPQRNEVEVAAEAIELPPITGLAGKTVALTGTFTTMKRADAQKLLREAGATVGSGVTKATEVLIYGDNAGSKLDKATSAGITLMTEAEMVALLTAGGAGKEQLAGAEEKLAEKQAKASASATEMT